MDGSDWIALGAAVIAGIALVVSILERSDRKKAIAQEADDREAGLTLLRQQVEGETADRERQRRADLTATAGRVSGGENGGRIDRHYFTVTNLGPAIARERGSRRSATPGTWRRPMRR